jgi:hypothetical protein
MTWTSLAQHSTAIGPSPIAMMTKDERTSRFLSRIALQLDMLREADANGQRAEELILSREEMTYVRKQWEDIVLHGEHKLHSLASLLSEGLLRTENIQRVARVVAGPKEEVETSDSRIVIEEFISPEQLNQTTDYRLAAEIARRYLYRPHGGDEFASIYARALFLEFRPLELGDGSVATRVITRVKANDAIWNKVTDALFSIDSVISRDKILNTKSKYVKDVFGIKILVGQGHDCYAVESQLDDMDLRPRLSGLNEQHLGQLPDQLELVERKDYLESKGRKKTGWQALKNVYRWGHHYFEIQIQTEANYFAEISDLSSTSHRTFEMQRRHLRWELEDILPHYRDFRHLLRGIFDTRKQFNSLERLNVDLDWVKLVA